MKFIRNTHNQYDQYRGDNYFSEIDHILSGYVHFLEDKPLTLDEIVKGVNEYNNLYPDAPFANDIQLIALALIRMCESGLARQRKAFPHEIALLC